MIGWNKTKGQILALLRWSDEYHVELEQKEYKEQDAEVVMKEEVELKHHAKENKKKG